MPELTQNKDKLGKRDAVIDNAKGLLVLAFMVVHVLRNMPKTFVLSDWFYHSEPILISWWGFNILDLAPIAFFFFIGFVAYPAFENNLKTIGKAAYRAYFTRNLAVVGLFMCVAYFEVRIVGSGTYWSYLVSIGFTGVLLTPFLTRLFRKNAYIKLIAGAAVLTLYFFLRPKLLELVGTYSGYGGGPAACVGFLGVVLITAGISQIAKKGIVPYAAATAVLYLIGLLFTVFLTRVPIEAVPSDSSGYAQFTVTYMIGALSKVNLIYFIFSLFNLYILKNKPIPFLVTFGRNILLYLLMTLILIAVFKTLPIFKPAGVLVCVLRLIVCAALYMVTAIPLAKKKILFKL